MPGNSGKLSPAEVFTVPSGVRYLEPEQLASLENEFERWKRAARTPQSLLSRERLHAVFLLLRHTGARLGEVLALDELQDIDRERAMVTLGRENGRREVPLPPVVFAQLRRFLDGPMTVALTGEVFHLDPGYVRRIFYDRAKACDIPKELGSPRGLRNTRAVEMLRSGVPLAVVRDMLGQSSTDLVAVFQHYSRGDAHSIVKRLALRDFASRTSARNSFLSHVTGIRRDGVMAEIMLTAESGQELCAIITVESVLNLGLEAGTPVITTVKAPLVNVFRIGEVLRGSARNRVEATVSSLRRTEVMCEVSGSTEAGEKLCALIATAMAEDMELAIGDRVEFRFKALSVVLNTL